MSSPVSSRPAHILSKRQTFGKSVELKSAKYSWDRIWSNTFKLQHGTVAVPSMFANTSELWSESTKNLGCSWDHEISWIIMISWCRFSLDIPWFSFDVTASDVPLECFVTGGWPGPVSTTAQDTLPPPKSISWGSPLWPPDRRVNQSSGIVVLSRTRS